ncbi:MAG: prolyl oligopeptidase family serine peptidase [Planctomycetota bacterium]
MMLFTGVRTKPPRRASWFLTILCLTTGAAHGQTERRRSTVQSHDFLVQGQTRQAIIIEPSVVSESPPIVFVFHGHGGSGRNMARKGFDKAWPEAVFVFPNGLPTATRRDPEGKRSGWQNRAGTNQDRDLDFFDVMLRFAEDRYKVDGDRVFATGHSNGGGMTGLLWAMRRDQLAAVAISAGGSGEPGRLQPLPVLHLAGRKDPIVPFSNQQRSIAWFRNVNQTDDESIDMPGIGQRYSSPNGTDVVVHNHDGGHEFLPDAPKRITLFFRSLKRPEEGYPINESLPERTAADRSQVFERLDRNADRVITPDELTRPQLFQRLDRDQDGRITIEEANASTS